jgi:hypothetical protein
MAGSNYNLLKGLNELRDSCISCVLKHLSQALILMQEVHQGYPKHHWIAVGHLGEAADEAVKEFPELAAEIRKHRVKYMADPKYSVPILDLIEKAQKHMKNESVGPADPFALRTPQQKKSGWAGSQDVAGRKKELSTFLRAAEARKKRQAATQSPATPSPTPKPPAPRPATPSPRAGMAPKKPSIYSPSQPSSAPRKPQRYGLKLGFSGQRRYEDGLQRTSYEFKSLKPLAEVSPPGWAGTVRAMKTHGHTGKGKDDIDNPYALAWWMKKRGDKPHYKDQPTSKKGKPEKKENYKDDKEEAMSLFDDIITEKELTTAGRKRIKKGNFAIPEKAPGSGSYPIHDLAHARNALSRVSAHGTSSEKSRVRAAVYSKYPGLKARKDEGMSIFDPLIERELPEAFKKNIGKWKTKGDGEAKPEAVDGEESADACESVSIFDDIVETKTENSVFDEIVENKTKPEGSVFDEIVESKAPKTAPVDWDDRAARTLALSEELVEIRSSIKDKK